MTIVFPCHMHKYPSRSLYRISMSGLVRSQLRPQTIEPSGIELAQMPEANEICDRERSSQTLEFSLVKEYFSKTTIVKWAIGGLWGMHSSAFMTILMHILRAFWSPLVP